MAVELSYPEFKAPTVPNPHHSRGGYYKNWLGHGRDSKRITRPRQASNSDHDEGPLDGNEEAPSPEPVVDTDTMQIDPTLLGESEMMRAAEARAKSKTSSKRQNKPEEILEKSDTTEPGSLEDIQILDLHSPRPIISYRGRIFEGQWAEVIGTEIILRQSGDGDRPLPALRHLAEGVDVLAASASRIMTTEKKLQPRMPPDDSLADIKEKWTIKIPVGKDKSGEKAQQAQFLERLIALKLKKGEPDQVTVYAKDGEGQDFKDHKNPDSQPRRKKRVLPSQAADPAAASSSFKRRGAEGSRRRARAKRGRPTRGSDSLHFDSATKALSTPTPNRWEDLEGMGEERVEAMDLEDVEDESERGRGEPDGDSNDNEDGNGAASDQTDVQYTEDEDEDDDEVSEDEDDTNDDGSDNSQDDATMGGV
jgi:hypothetical protein